MTYQIYTASKLSAANQKATETLAIQKLGASGKAEVIVDSSLLAGVKIVVGSQLLDLSLAGQIDRLSTAITKE